MDLKGSINIMRYSDYFTNNLINLDFPKVTNDFERDNLPYPEYGDLIITLHDYSLNVYDDSPGFWKKLRSQHSLDRAIALSNSYTNYQCSIVCFTISTLNSAEECGELSSPRYDASVFSNGHGDIGFLYAGYQSHPNNIGGWGDGVAGQKNLIEYIQISTAKTANIFGEAEYADIRHCGTSNAELSRGLIVGGNSDVDRMSVLNLQSKGNSTYWGNMNTGYGNYPFSLSNATGDRAVFGGGTSLVTNVAYSTISTGYNSISFGTLTTSASASGGTSNGELNRGVILNVDNVIEYITITTLGKALDFGDLTTKRNNIQPTSNRLRNRALAISGTQYNYQLSNDYFDISTLGNASLFGDLTTDYHLAATRATSNS